MSAIKIIQGFARKSLTKNQGSGIINLPGAMQSEAKAGEIVAMLQQAGIPMNQLDDFIRSEADVAKFLNIIEAASKPKVYSGQAAVDQLNKLFPKKGEVVQFPQKTSFKEQVEAMKKSGDIVDPNNLKKNDKVLERDMFNNSNLNKTDTVADTISYIKTLEPVKAMKEANSIIGRKGKYKNLTPEESKKILTDTEDHIFQRDPDNLYDYDPEDMAKGGRAGYAVGNQVMPAIDERMNLDYNTLVDQNTAQRGTQTQNRNPVKQNFLDRMKRSFPVAETFMNVAAPAINLGRGILGLQDPIGTPSMGDRMRELEATKGPTGSIGYEDYGLPVATPGGRFTGGLPELALSNPVDFALAGSAGRYGFSPEGRTDLKYDFTPDQDTGSTGNAILDFVNEGGVKAKVSDLLAPTTAMADQPSAMPQGSPGQLNPTPTQNAGPSRETIIQRILKEIEPGFENENSIARMYPDDYKTGLDLDYLKTLNPDDIKLALDNAYLQGENFQNPDFSTGRIGGGRPFFRYGPEYMEKTNRSNTLSLSTQYTGYNLRNQLGELESILGKEGVKPYRTKLDDALINLYKNNYSGDSDLQKRIFGLAKGGRAGFYTGGITDVEPSLDDIGHGADALNARTRLMSPGAQATTSTGLNYLLAEDNDNMRVPFAGGGDPKRRAFLKLMATLTGGAAAFKSGLLSLGEGGAKKAVSETVKKAAGSGGEVPPYFFKLVEKIKILGDDVTSKSATLDRQKVKQYKDYELTEDVSTGEIQIMKRGQGDVDAFVNENANEEVFMRYKPGKSQADETTKGKKIPDEYEENTSYISNNRGNTGDVLDVEDGVPDSVIMEVEAGSGNVPESSYTGPNKIKRADGGRIGFSAGSLAKLGINSTSRRFLEKVFGKEKFQTMIQNDPRMHRGMLEVVEMFRNKDKDGLKMYLQKFMPNMDDTEIEKFIVGDSGTEGIEGQLIRLGSGREYENLIKMSKEADQIRKLDDFDIEDVSKNAEGGRIGFSGGGIFRAIIAKSAAKKGMSVTDFIKATNYKGLPPEVRMYISADEFAKLKGGQQDLYENFIDMAKTRKSFQENVEAGKKGPASPLFENLEKTMDEQSFVPKTVTSDDIAQMELMVKNRFNKGRKDNAQGGLQTMLGE